MTNKQETAWSEFGDLLSIESQEEIEYNEKLEEGGIVFIECKL